MMAGHDTTAFCCSYTVYLLAQHPEVRLLLLFLLLFLLLPLLSAINPFASITPFSYHTTTTLPESDILLLFPPPRCGGGKIYSLPTPLI